MGELFDGVRAPSTLGSFLRAFSWGNVRQLEVVSRRLLAELTARAPVLPDARGRDQITLHLPEHWPWYDAWDGLFNATHRTAHRAPPTRVA